MIIDYTKEPECELLYRELGQVGEPLISIINTLSQY